MCPLCGGSNVPPKKAIRINDSCFVELSFLQYYCKHDLSITQAKKTPVAYFFSLFWSGEVKVSQIKLCNVENDVFRGAADIVRVLRVSGFSAWFVGGAVRDMLLGKMPKDIDIVTSARPAETSEIFPDNQQVGAAFGIVLVRQDGMQFEVATFREERNYLDGRHPELVRYTDDPETDVLRRDFTVNGMLFDPENGEVLDYTNGQDDLARGVIRTIGDPEIRFAEDHLRMLRAVRFASRFGFELEQNTFKAILKMKSDIKKLAAERVREELNLMFTGSHPAYALKLLDETGLLEEILPEVNAMKGVTQPEMFHPEGDVFEHTLLMMRHMAMFSVELAWSILLHDVGKPSTAAISAHGHECFYRHEQVGAEMAVHIMERLKFSNKQIQTVKDAIENHMRFGTVDRMRPVKIRRLMAGENFPLELELHRIDCLSSHQLMGNFNLLLDRLIFQSGEVQLPPPLITGRDLIEAGFKPGPEFKKILETVQEMQLTGDLKSKNDAMCFIEKHFLA
jgi:poly(A) polymerase